MLQLVYPHSEQQGRLCNEIQSKQFQKNLFSKYSAK